MLAGISLARQRPRAEESDGADRHHESAGADRCAAYPLNAARRQQERAVDRFGSLQEVRENAEREYILKKLEETKGNVTRRRSCWASSAAISIAR